jgi:hypothetical protein
VWVESDDNSRFFVRSTDIAGEAKMRPTNLPWWMGGSSRSRPEEAGVANVGLTN